MKMFAQIKMSKLKHSAAAAAFGPNERHQKWSTRTRKIKPATGFVLQRKRNHNIVPSGNVEDLLRFLELSLIACCN